MNLSDRFILLNGIDGKFSRSFSSHFFKSAVSVSPQALIRKPPFRRENLSGSTIHRFQRQVAFKVTRMFGLHGLNITFQSIRHFELVGYQCIRSVVAHGEWKESRKDVQVPKEIKSSTVSPQAITYLKSYLNAQTQKMYLRWGQCRVETALTTKTRTPLRFIWTFSGLIHLLNSMKLKCRPL